jgi:hypothetical protein
MWWARHEGLLRVIKERGLLSLGDTQGGGDQNYLSQDRIQVDSSFFQLLETVVGSLERWERSSVLSSQAETGDTWFCIQK